MKLEEYKEKIKRTFAELGTPEKNNLHMVLGMATEIGEILNPFKSELAYKKNIDWTNIIEELGDLFWFTVSFCNINNINIEDVFDKNIAKLQSRYPEKFTEYDANNRDLERERQILEE